MTDREKLAELIGKGRWMCSDICSSYDDCDLCNYSEDGSDCHNTIIADHLLANGVTVQRWIPVTERLPEVARRVLVTDGENVSFGYVLNYEHKDWNPWCVQYPCIYNKVTHWMPLPEPPKEGE